MKYLITTLTILSLFFVACSNDNITYDLSDEKIAEYESMLEENLELIKEDGLTEGDYNEALKNIAVSYERLGETQKAIDYYELLLERHESNFTALNNLTAIYDELEDWDKAMEYGLLYFNYYGNREDIADKVIRIYVEAGNYEGAKGLLEFFAANYQNEENIQFIGDTFEYIGRVQAKHGSSEE